MKKNIKTGKKGHNVSILSILSFVLLALTSCGTEDSNMAEVNRTVNPKKPKHEQLQNISASSWNTGLLPATSTNSANLIVDPTLLKPLNFTLGGSRIFKSNNPEIFTGNGWLSQHARTDATRGGSATPLSGTFPVYLFHISNATSMRWVHILVSNPNSTNITVSARGAMYTNTAGSAPYTGPSTGQSYRVAANWLANTLPITLASTSVAPQKMVQVARIEVGPSNMVDGRFEVTTSGGAYVYTVVTSNGDFNSAVSLSQGGPAPGIIATPSASTFGREAGVYANSTVTGTTDVYLPTGQANVGICLNTTNKFQTFLQDQTAPAVAALGDSSPRTYGNYGHYYDVTLRIRNTGATARRVRLYFASNATTANVTSMWNGPVRLNGTTINVWNTPAQPRQQLAEWVINAGSIFDGRLSFYAPGLLTTNQQLILETRD